MKVAARAAVLLLFVSLAPITHGQTAIKAPAGYPAIGELARITMLSPGAEPRKPLRYVVAKDYKGHMDMDMTMSMAMSMAGQSMPPMALPTMRIGADMAVTAVGATGDITYSLAFSGMDLVTAQGQAPDPNMAAMFAPLSEEFKKISGTATVTNRGVTRESKLDISKITNPALTQTMGSVTNSLNSMSTPFPEEAVGLGAKWEVRQAMDSGGVTIFQKVTCELTAYDGKSVTLKMTLEQTAPSQPVKNPSMPGMDMMLDSMTGSGSGTMTTAFDSLVPSSDMTMKSAMSMSMSGQTMGVETNLKLQVSAPKK
jgi:hypothetical protein